MKAWRYYEIEAGLMIPFDPDLSFKPGVQVFQSFVPCKDFFCPCGNCPQSFVTLEKLEDFM